MRAPSPRRALLAAPVTAALLVGGCGSGSNNAAAAPTATQAGTAPAPASSATTPSRAVTVSAAEYAFAPMTIDARAGRLKLTLDNKGKIPHELVVLKTGHAAGALRVEAGRVSEDTSVGEVPETAGGAVRSATLDLAPGRYVLVCNIPGHYEDGMRGTLTVR